jgi:hypothetical protein
MEQCRGGSSGARPVGAMPGVRTSIDQRSVTVAGTRLIVAEIARSVAAGTAWTYATRLKAAGLTLPPDMDDAALDVQRLFARHLGAHLFRPAVSVPADFLVVSKTSIFETMRRPNRKRPRGCAGDRIARRNGCDRRRPPKHSAGIGEVNTLPRQMENAGVPARS